jgi:hypothetical protein
LVRAVLNTMYEEASDEDLLEMRADVSAGMKHLPQHHRTALEMRAQGYTLEEFYTLLTGRNWKHVKGKQQALEDIKDWFAILEGELTAILNGEVSELLAA